jgi:hypothetical protein
MKYKAFLEVAINKVLSTVNYLKKHIDVKNMKCMGKSKY